MASEDFDQQDVSEGRPAEFGSGEEPDLDGETPLSDEYPLGAETEEVPHKKAGAPRLLILLLALIVGVGAALYLFGQALNDPGPPVAPVKVQTQNKMKVPERPVAVVKPEEIKEEIVPAAKVAAVEEKPQALSVVVPKPAPPVLVPAFALTAGSYLNQGTVKKTLTRIEKMGYQVESSSVPEAREMFRLLVGRYAKSQALKKLAEIRKFSDGAFIAAEEGKYAVYAGSFLSIDKARRLADIVYAQGVRVDEVKAMVNLPRTTLRFGGFATRAEAQSVLHKLKKRGIVKLQIVPFK